MRSELKRLQRELGISFVHVTHSQDEALALADRIIVMNNGRIEQDGPPREVFNAPRTEFVARFIGGHNILEQRGAKFAVRTDCIHLTRTRMPDAVAASVREVEYLGTIVNVTLVTGQDVELVATMPEGAFFADPVDIGETAHLTWDTNDSHQLAV
jgi:putative spermidine/putrescine transport system ATP-binding protein